MLKVDSVLLLAEIEDVIRTAPPQLTMHQVESEVLAWLGRASSLIRRWNPMKGVMFDSDVRQLHAGRHFNPATSVAGILTALHEARHDLRFSEVGPLSVSVSRGNVFDYFDEVRKIIGSAQKEIFFIDPFLDSEFVSRFLSLVPAEICVRLLCKKGISALLPAVNLMREQNKITVELRGNSSLHDRYLFVDRKTGFQSGASFKDGARFAPTTLTEITDAFNPVLSIYEKLWLEGTVYL